MEEIDLSLPSKFIDASVKMNFDEAYRLVKLMAKQHHRSLEQEFLTLKYAASALSNTERVAVLLMIKDIRKYEA